MTDLALFAVLYVAVLAPMYAYAFWRGRRYERAWRAEARGGYITIDPRPFDHEWDWPVRPVEREGGAA